MKVTDNREHGMLARVWCITMPLARAISPATGLVWHDEDLAPLLGTYVPVITSYAGHSIYTLKDTL